MDTKRRVYGGGAFPLFVCGMYTTGSAERAAFTGDALNDLADRCARQNLRLASTDVRAIAGLNPHRDPVGACVDDIQHRGCWVVVVVGAATDAPVDAPADPPRYPWQVPEDTDGLRRAELDLAECIAAHPYLRERCFIYVHESLRRGKASPRTKQLLRGLAESAVAVRVYDEPAGLLRALREDLGGAIDAFNTSADGSAIARHERAAQATFAESRSAAYIPIGDYAARIDRLMGTAGGVRVALVGESGAGKSAFLAHWAPTMRREREDTVVVEYYAGAAAHETDERVALRHVLAGLRDACSITMPIPTDPNDMLAALGDWPAYAGARKVIVVLDGLDQLAEPTALSRWLAESRLPANLVLVVSTQPQGTAYAELLEPLWNFVPMAPLSVDDRWHLIDGSLRDNAARLPAWLKTRITGTNAITTPLFLRALIEGLPVEGTIADVERRLEALLAAPSMEALLEGILAGLESEATLGKDLVRDTLCLVWASHHGLTLEELTDLVASSSRHSSSNAATARHTVAVEALLARLGSFLALRDGRLTFFHDSPRRAVEARYLTRPKGRRVQAKGDSTRAGSNPARAYRRRLAEYFTAHASPERRAAEAPWQWSKVPDREQLIACITDIPTFMALATEEHQWELLGYWHGAGVEDPAALYIAALARLRPEPTAEAAARILLRLGEMFLLAAHHAAAVAVLTRACAYPGTDVLAIRIRVRLSVAHHMGGDLSAEEELLAPLQDRVGRNREEHVALLEGLEALANLYCARTAFGKAARALEQALPLSTGLHKTDHIQTLGIITLMGLVAIRRGHFRAAESMMRQVLDACRRLHKSPHPAIASALGNLAAALQPQDRLDDAMRLVREAVEINEQLYPDGHPETAYKLINLGYMMRLAEEYDAAERQYLRALKILEAVFGLDHLEVAHCSNNMGTLYTWMGRFVDAGKCFVRARAIYAARLPGDSDRLISVDMNIAWMHLQHDEPLRAAQGFATVLPRRIAASGVGHSATQRALANFRIAVAAARERNPESPEVLRVVVALAEVESLCGNHAEVIALLGAEVPRMERILGAITPPTLRAIALLAAARAALDDDDDGRNNGGG